MSDTPDGYEPEPDHGPGPDQSTTPTSEDPASPMMVIATVWHEHFMAFRGAGFTELQALFLTMSLFRNWSGEFNT